MIALLWACDDVTHGGWGVLAVESSGQKIEITAAADQPDKVRLRLIPVQELLDLTGAATPADLRGLSVILAVYAVLAGAAMALYPFPWIRYAIVAATLAALVIKRNQVIDFVKRLKER